MSQKYEGPAEVYLQVKGTGATSALKLMVEMTSLTVTVNSNAKPIRTMQKGLAGRAPGPVEVEASMESAIPVSGMEADYQKAVIDNADIFIVHKLGNVRRSYDGWLESGESSQSAENPATTSARFMGSVIGEAPAVPT